MNKLALMCSFICIQFSLIATYDPYTYPNREKIYILEKQDNTIDDSIWNSKLIKAARSISSFGLSVIGFINILDLALAPLTWPTNPRRGYSCFGEYVICNGLNTFITLFLADILRVKKNKIKIEEKIIDGKLVIVEKHY